jgi:hypothetical protein
MFTSGGDRPEVFHPCAAARPAPLANEASGYRGRAAPDLNPVEGLWSSLKAVELANLTSPTLAEVIGLAHKGVERLRRTPHLAYSFLRHAGLSVS